MKAKILALLLSLLPSFAMAQTTPLPAQSVWGRLGQPGDTGPGQAIPFATLLAQINGTQSANKVFAGPSSGGVALPTFRSLVGADLPVPGASSLGGTFSFTCSTSNWFNTISTAGQPGCSQPNFTDLAGSIAGSQIPTGTITSTMILDGTILNADINSAAAIALSKLAAQNTKTIVGNSTGGSAVPTALTGDAVGAILCAPSRSLLTPGTNQTYTTPTCNGSLPTRLELEFTGGGAGGAGSGTTPGSASVGSQACFGTNATACTTPIASANGGSAASTTAGTFAAGGTTSGCDLGLTGGVGGETATLTTQIGGLGGIGFFGGAGQPGYVAGVAQAGQAAATNTGSGGGGASSVGTANNGGGGGAGGYCRKMITSPASSYFYTTGTAGAGGTLGTSGAAGGNGAAGPMIVTAYWQ